MRTVQDQPLVSLRPGAGTAVVDAVLRFWTEKSHYFRKPTEGAPLLLDTPATTKPATGR